MADEPKKNRVKGSVQAVVGVVVGALLLSWRPSLAYIAWAGSTLVLVIALAAPLTLYPRLQSIWQMLGRGIGVVLTWLLLGAIYYLVFTPLGFVRRCLGHPPLNTSPRLHVTSYWQDHATDAVQPESYKRQY